MELSWKRKELREGKRNRKRHHLWTLQPQMCGCVKQAEMQASFLGSAGGKVELNLSYFHYVLCSYFNKLVSLVNMCFKKNSLNNVDGQ